MSTIEKPDIKRSSLSTAKRIDIKVGSSLLTDLELGLNRGRITDYSSQIVELIDDDREVVDERIVFVTRRARVRPCTARVPRCAPVPR